MNDLKVEISQQPVEPAQPTGIARRRLLRAGFAAAPVILTLTGRSAMAGDCAKGLSPLAWTSVAPNGRCIGSSHTVEGNTLGRSPGYWKPNKAGQTFQPPYKWPVAPFTEVTMPAGSSTKVQWDPSKDFDYYKDIAHTDTGYDEGVKFSSVFGGSDARSFSRVLIDGNRNFKIEWHVTAAYLNCQVPELSSVYAIRLDELKLLYTEGRLVPGGKVLQPSEIKAFLDQTWV